MLITIDRTIRMIIGNNSKKSLLISLEAFGLNEHY